MIQTTTNVIEMKGQLSVEYLIIAVISLIIISTSIAVLGTIRSNGEKTFTSYQFRSFANSLFVDIDELCVLGNGNSREIVVPFAVKLYSEVNTLSITTSEASVSYKSRCEVDLEGEFSETIELRNEKGVIKND